MRKLLLLMTALLTLGVSGAWADVLPSAVVGTTAFQATALTTGASDYSISKNGDGNVTIYANDDSNLGTYTVSGNKNYLTCTLVVKINVPSTPSPGILCQMRKAADNTSAAQGLYLTSDRKLKTSWEKGAGRQTDANAPELAAGEHTIIYTAGPELTGAKVYIDGTTAAITDGGLRGGDAYYKVIYIPAAYAQYITEVHLFNSIQNATNITSIVTECSNHMHASQETGASVTVPSGKMLVIDKDDNLSKYSFDGASNIIIASGKTLSLDKNGSTISSLTGSGTALQSTNITTTVTGNLTDLTLKATAGTLTYTGINLSGTTLDGVILGGSERITTSGTVNIKNLAGNNLTASTNDYTFVGSGTLNIYGTCDLTKKSDGTATNFSKLGYGSSASINIKEGAIVTTTAVLNTSTSNNNAPVTVESGATLGGEYVYGNVTLGEGSNITLSDQYPFNRGTVTVSGNATLNLTATTASLNQPITVAADKTLTIDGGSNTVNLNVVPTFGASSKINFEDATINFNKDIRNLTNYTFTSSTAQFVETTDEYKAGGFTITDIPSGVTIKVKKYGVSGYDTVTPIDGTVTISHSVGVSGSAAWLDYTFNESTKATNTGTSGNVIKNAGNAGESGNNLTLDSSNGNQYTPSNSYNEDGTLKVESTPYRTVNWPTNYTVAVAGNVPDVENGCLVAFGTLSGGYLAILRGDASNKILLVKGTGQTAFETITEMTAANATELSHLVVFTKNGDTFKVYLDGVQKAQVTYSETLGSGFQIGSLHGGITNTGIVRVSYMDDAIAKAKVFAKAIRVYDYVISNDQMSQLTTEFPYTSFGGTYSRTISGDSNLSATDAWLNKGNQGYDDVPVNTVRDAVTYYPDVEITTTAASTLTVNADMDAENITFDGAGKLTIASDGTHNIHIYGSVTANGPVSVKYGETDLSAVPVTIGESGSVEFDFSASDFSSVNAPTDYPVTGNTADYGSKVTGVYPSDIYHTYTLAYNGSTNSYYLTVAPSVALKQQQAIDLVTPYYNGNHVGAGVGKYTISLGETSYANLADFRTAVMSWATIGDCVEPTIAINQPTSAFYRIKSGSKYLQDVRKSDSATQRTMTDTDGAETIFYLNGNTLVGYKTGYGFGYSVCQTRDTEQLNTQLFTESAEMGKYTIQSQQGTCTSADYNEGYWGIDDSDLSRKADAASGACWTIESVTTLPITFIGEYASFYSPVDLTIPGDAGVKVYTGTVNGEWLTLNEVTGTLPANTGVILKGTAGQTVNFPILPSTTPAESALTGTIAAQPAIANGVLVLGKDNNDVWGIYNYTGERGGFKAYMIKPAAGVKGFSFRFGDTDAIQSISDELSRSEIYDISGRRVSKPTQGLYIVNGKKVVIK